MRACASSTASRSSVCVNQFSQAALAQNRSGLEELSKAGSKVPLGPSRAYRVTSGFLPEVVVDALAAMDTLVSLREESLNPKVSTP